MVQGSLKFTMLYSTPLKLERPTDIHSSQAGYEYELKPVFQGGQRVKGRQVKYPIRSSYCQLPMQVGVAVVLSLS